MVNTESEISRKLDLSETLCGEPLAEGPARGMILTSGRDQVFGNGDYRIPSNLTNLEGDKLEKAGKWVDTTATNMKDILTAIQDKNDTKSQIIEKIIDITVEAAGSDDLIIGSEFLVRRDSGTRITHIYPAQYEHRESNNAHIYKMEAGETMTIKGVTNRNPSNSIVVSLEDSWGSPISHEEINEWGRDGEWECQLTLSEDISQGKYELSANDGDREIPIMIDILPKEKREDDPIEIKTVTQQNKPAVVFVEGRSDKAILEGLSQVIAEHKKSRISLKDSNTTVRPIGGDNLKKEGEEINDYYSYPRIPHFFVVDSDDKNPNQKKQELKENHLNSAPLYVLDEYCIESYLLSSPRAIAQPFGLDVNKTKEFIAESSGRPNKKEVMKDLFRTIAGRSYDEEEHGWTISRNFNFDDIPDELDELIERMEKLPSED
jgi:hypothetical protein